jgi:hypothetical protein
VNESLSSWIVVVGGRWSSFQMVLTWRHGARVWCWGMALGFNVNGPRHTNYVSPSFGPFSLLCALGGKAEVLSSRASVGLCRYS